ncbi:3-dehydroquinate dehydratase [Xanthomonas campestris pv. raphani]|uniref:3-dehydroquinate dehydratase n=1 Tax=Xanthomonas campestris TaxID=339 RepID=UPI002367E527|nr:3-dehydroquinate dehydratase [Xanthomonas campestris]MEA9825911.1 3-dehydroquinate dehydratase [Xanthomonas campestris pv. raphani]MEA9854182.1 3-dehydroquinate dehydratase [Xanthomonas campestris pv. raphani]MEA9858372.1 3-dehydroquinate dehydratase [Xanthomonas campestris pv. raphani]MEA9967364.1 3-dehydroquinate dehydratase [Xanthomonas campestris pv. raphani]WDJ22376.1 3-dehydroquinate dehydratase [Xanthomonas campestris pv. raphani]
MSIMILRGPEAASSLVRGPQALPRAVITQLVRCAGDAGKTVALRACGSEQELLDALRVAGQARMEIVLIDPGSCVDSVRGYCAQSYLLGLEIALEHLGCTEIQGDVHVGT